MSKHSLRPGCRNRIEEFKQNHRWVRRRPILELLERRWLLATVADIESVADSGTPADDMLPSANVRQEIKVNGTGFDVSSRIIFPTINRNGTVSTEIVTPTRVAADGTSILAVIPDAALTGNVSFNDAPETPFLQIVPTAVDIDLTSGFFGEGADIYVYGSGFSEGDVIVRFGATEVLDSSINSGPDVGNYVSKGGLAGGLDRSENDVIFLDVPAAASTGPITISNAGGTSEAVPISFSQIVSTAAAGVAASGAQPSANTGQHIRVLGDGLDITTEIIFPTVDSSGTISNTIRTPTFVKADGTEIEVRVPDNALTGNVRVVGAAGTFPLQVVPTLEFARRFAADDIWLRGSGFTENTGLSVDFGGTTVNDTGGNIDVANGFLSNTDLNVTQPGGSSDVVTVTTAGGTSQSVTIPVDDPPSVGDLRGLAVFPATAGADADRLVVTDTGGTMHVLEPGSLASVRTITRPGPATSIAGIDFITAQVVVQDSVRGDVTIPSGSLAYVNSTATPDRLYYLDPAGSGTVLADVPLAGPTPGDVVGAGGLAWHADRGTFFVTRAGSDVITEIDPATGAAVQSFYTNFSASTFQNRGDLTVDPATGNLWFGGFDERLVQIDPASGKVIGNYDPIGNDQLGTIRLEQQGLDFRTDSDVSGLDFDNSGNLLTTTSASSRILTLRPPGVPTGLRNVDGTLASAIDGFAADPNVPSANNRQRIRILGSNFTTVTEVEFPRVNHDGSIGFIRTRAAVVSDDGTMLEVVVPNEAVTGRLKVAGAPGDGLFLQVVPTIRGIIPTDANATFDQPRDDVRNAIFGSGFVEGGTRITIGGVLMDDNLVDSTVDNFVLSGGSTFFENSRYDFNVPNRALVGPLRVTTAGGYFEIDAMPIGAQDSVGFDAITSTANRGTPADAGMPSANVGQLLTLEGYNLKTTSNVVFTAIAEDGTRSQVVVRPQSATGSTATVRVPPQAITGPVTVAGATDSIDLQVVPVILGFSEGSLVPGASVRIEGTGISEGGDAVGQDVVYGFGVGSVTDTNPTLGPDVLASLKDRVQVGLNVPGAANGSVVTVTTAGGSASFDVADIITSDLSAEPQGSGAADGVGGTLATATAISVGSNSATDVTGRISFSGDVDLFRLGGATEAGILSLRRDTTVGIGNDSVIRVFDETGNQLTGQNLGDLIRYVLPDRAEYYIGYSRWNNTSYDPVDGSGTIGSGEGDYAFTVRYAAVGTTSLGAITSTADSGTPRDPSIASANTRQLITITGEDFSANTRVRFTAFNSEAPQNGLYESEVTPTSVAGDGLSLQVAVPDEAVSGLVRVSDEPGGLILQIVPKLDDIDLRDGFFSAGATMRLAGGGFIEGQQTLILGSAIGAGGAVDVTDVWDNRGPNVFNRYGIPGNTNPFRYNANSDFKLPSDPPTGPMKVRTFGGTSTAEEITFTGIASGTVATSGTPAVVGMPSANVDQLITLTGTNFDAFTDIIFSTQPSGSDLPSTRRVSPSQVAADGTSLQVVVPDDARTGPIRIVGVEDGANLQIVPTLVQIDSPATFATNQTMTLKGSGFIEGGIEIVLGSTVLKDTLPFQGPDVVNNVLGAGLDKFDNDHLTFRLPPGAQASPIIVRTAGGEATLVSVSGFEATALQGTPANATIASANVGQMVRILGQGINISTEIIFPIVDNAGTLSTQVVTPSYAKVDGTLGEVVVPGRAITGTVQVVGAPQSFELQVVPTLKRAERTGTTQVSFLGSGFTENKNLSVDFGGTPVTDTGSNINVVNSYLDNDTLHVDQPGSSGDVVRVITAGGSSPAVTIGANDPADVGDMRGIAVFPATAGADAGKLVVADTNGVFQVLDPVSLARERTINRPGVSGGEIGMDFITAGVTVQDPVRGAVAVPAGSLAVVNGNGDPDRLFYLDPTGTGTVLADVVLGGSIPNDMRAAGAVTWHAGRGTLFAMRLNSDVITEIDPATGAALRSFHTNVYTSTFQDRAAITVDESTGNLWIGGDPTGGQTRISEVDPDTGRVLGNYDPISNAQLGSIRVEQQGVGFVVIAGLTGFDFDNAGRLLATTGTGPSRVLELVRPTGPVAFANPDNTPLTAVDGVPANVALPSANNRQTIRISGSGFNVLTEVEFPRIIHDGQRGVARTRATAVSEDGTVMELRVPDNAVTGIVRIAGADDPGMFLQVTPTLRKILPSDSTVDFDLPIDGFRWTSFGSGFIEGGTTVTFGGVQVLDNVLDLVIDTVNPNATPRSNDRLDLYVPNRALAGPVKVETAGGSFQVDTLPVRAQAAVGIDAIVASASRGTPLDPGQPNANTGQTITLQGFGLTTSSNVIFTGVAEDGTRGTIVTHPNSATGDTAIVVVPALAVTGPVTVAGAAGGIDLLVVPTLDGISQKALTPGATLRLGGSGIPEGGALAGQGVLYSFGGDSVTDVSGAAGPDVFSALDDALQIDLTIPAGASGSVVTVNTAGGSDTFDLTTSSISDINALAARGTATSSAIASANTRQSITINGAGFDSSTRVRFTTFRANSPQSGLSELEVTPTSVAGDGSSLDVTVPDDAVTGRVRISGESGGLLLQIVPFIDDVDLLSTYYGATADLKFAGGGYIEGQQTLILGSGLSEIEVADVWDDRGPDAVDNYNQPGSVVSRPNANTTFEVPVDAPSGPFRIRTLGGTSDAEPISFSGFVTGTTADAGIPAVGAIASANVDQAITLQGDGFDIYTEVIFPIQESGQDLQGTRRVGVNRVSPDGTEILVVVPDDAVTGEVFVVGSADRHALQIVPKILHVNAFASSFRTGDDFEIWGSGFIENDTTVDVGGGVLEDTLPFHGLNVLNKGFAGGQNKLDNDGIDLDLPPGAGGGPVTVRTSGGEFTYSFDVDMQATALAGMPADLLERSANTGQMIVLTGNGLTLNTELLFPTKSTSGLRSTVVINPQLVSTDGTRAEFVVPYDALTGEVEVVGASQSFFLQIVPTLELVQRTSGTQVYLLGSGFHDGGGTTVDFGGTSVTDTGSNIVVLDSFFSHDTLRLNQPTGSGDLVTVTTAGGSSPALQIAYNDPPGLGDVRALAVFPTPPSGAPAPSPIVNEDPDVPAMRYDVNRDSRITPLDALQVINQIAVQLERSSGVVSEVENASDLSSRRDADVNADGAVTALDALLIINELGRQSTGNLIRAEADAASDAGKFLVTDTSGTMHVLDPTTLLVERTIARPGPATTATGIDFISAGVTVQDLVRGPVSVPPGSLAFINAGSDPDRLYYMDPTTGAVLADVQLGGSSPVDERGGAAVAWHPVRETLFVLRTGSDLISEIDPTTGAALKSFHTNITFSSSGSQGSLTVDPLTGNLLIAGRNRRLYQLDPESGRVIGNYDPIGNAQLGTIRLEELGIGLANVTEPIGMDFDNAGRLISMTLSGESRVVDLVRPTGPLALLNPDGSPLTAVDGTPANAALPSANNRQTIRITGSGFTVVTEVEFPRIIHDGQRGFVRTRATAVSEDGTVMELRVPDEAVTGNVRIAGAAGDGVFLQITPTLRDILPTDRDVDFDLPIDDFIWTSFGSGFVEGRTAVTFGGVQVLDNVLDALIDTTHPNVSPRSNDRLDLRVFERTLAGPVRVETAGGWFQVDTLPVRQQDAVGLDAIVASANRGTPADPGQPNANTGQTITLEGFSLTTSSNVIFSGVAEDGTRGTIVTRPSSANGSTATVVVPALAVTGPVTVAGAADSIDLLVVPTLDSISHSTLTPGAALRLGGTGIPEGGAAAGQSVTYTFGGDSVTDTSGTSGPDVFSALDEALHIELTTPVGTSGSEVTVSTAGGSHTLQLQDVTSATFVAEAQGDGALDGVGDTLSTATDISVGPNSSTYLSGRINVGTPGDVDMFRLVDAEPGGIISVIRDTSVGNATSKVVRIFDENGAQLTAIAGDLIHYGLPNRQEYYVGISQFANTTYNPIDGSDKRNTTVSDYAFTWRYADPATTSLNSITSTAARGMPTTAAIPSANTRQPITISGEGFDANSRVRFISFSADAPQSGLSESEVTPTSVAADGTSLVVTVPDDAVTGRVRIKDEPGGLMLQIVPFIDDVDLLSTFYGAGADLKLAGGGYIEGQQTLILGSGAEQVEVADVWDARGPDALNRYLVPGGSNISRPNANTSFEVPVDPPPGPFRIRTLGGTSDAEVITVTGAQANTRAERGTPTDTAEPSANVRQQITLEGTAFDAYTEVIFPVKGSNSDTIGTTRVAPSSVAADGTSMVVTVPDNAVTGNVLVVGSPDTVFLQIVPTIVQVTGPSVFETGRTYIDFQGSGFIEDDVLIGIGETFVQDTGPYFGPDVYNANITLAGKNRNDNDGLRLAVPPNAISEGPWTVTTAGGTARFGVIVDLGVVIHETRDSRFVAVGEQELFKATASVDGWLDFDVTFTSGRSDLVVLNEDGTDATLVEFTDDGTTVHHRVRTNEGQVFFLQTNGVGLAGASYDVVAINPDRFDDPVGSEAGAFAGNYGTDPDGLNDTNDVATDFSPAVYVTEKLNMPWNDIDWFTWVTQGTGQMDVTTLFTPANGELQFRVYRDSDGDNVLSATEQAAPVATSTPTAGGAVAADIAADLGQRFWTEVFGVDGDSNGMIDQNVYHMRFSNIDLVDSGLLPSHVPANNDTRANAVDLGTDVSWNSVTVSDVLTIDDPSDDDWFRVLTVVPGTLEVLVDLPNPQLGDVIARAVDATSGANLTLTEFEDLTDRLRFEFSPVAAGQEIQVELSGATNAYTFSIQNHDLAEPNPLMSDPANLGDVVHYRQALLSLPGLPDPGTFDFDWYRWTASAQDGRVDVTVTPDATFSGDATVRIWNDANDNQIPEAGLGELLAEGTSSGGSPVTVQTTAEEAQSLYVQIFDPNSGPLTGMVYTMDIANVDRFDKADVDGAANNTSATATDLGPIISADEPSLTLPPSDEDWFTATARVTGTVDVLVDALGDAVVVNVYEDSNSDNAPDNLVSTAIGTELSLQDISVSRGDTLWVQLLPIDPTDTFAPGSSYALQIINDDRFDDPIGDTLSGTVINPTGEDPDGRNDGPRTSGTDVEGTLRLVQPDPTVPTTWRGNIGVSTDGLGTFTTGNLQAEVPAGSTVELALLYVNTRSLTTPYRPTMIGFESSNVALSYLPNVDNSTAVDFETASADVTSIVTAKVGSSGGVFDFAIDETIANAGLSGDGNDFDLDQAVEGTALVVIYSNPTLPVRSVAVLEGGLSGPAVQQTKLALGTTVDKTDPNFLAQLSLGITFGFQPDGQFSAVSVNESRMTSSAGNFDDGVAGNGALVTVGGVGDSPANPLDPFNSGDTTDDELYDLAPFLNNGDREILLETSNPSDDDSIFLAVVIVSGEATVAPLFTDLGVVGESTEVDLSLPIGDEDWFRVEVGAEGDFVATIDYESDGTLDALMYRDVDLDGLPDDLNDDGVPDAIGTVTTGTNQIRIIDPPALSIGDVYLVRVFDPSDQVEYDIDVRINSATISGQVSDDDTGLGLSGVAITLKDAVGSVVATTTTDAGGNYIFTNLPPGDFTVEETNPATHPIDVSDKDDSPDGDSADANAVVDNAIGVTLTFAEADTDNNFVDSNDGSISGSVTDDDTTAGIPGVTITLKDAGGVVVVTTTTDAGGNYEFTNLDPGDYSVEETNPASHPTDISDQDASNDGDVADTDTTVDNIIGVTLAPGESDTDNNFVDSDDASISGSVTDDDTTAGIPGVTITLKDAGGVVVVTTTTDAGGNYGFTNLNPGNYSVEETNPASHPIDISDKDDSNDGDAADADTTVDNIIGVTLTAGEADTDNNFVDSNDGSISGSVTDDDTTAGIAGVTVTLKDAGGTTLVSTTTDPNGNYSFLDLDPGNYSVEETNPASHPTDISDQDASNDGDVADADTTVDNIIGVTLTAGEADTDNNFVDSDDASISGSVTDDDTTAGIPGVTITLKDAGSIIVATTTTDASGNYSFTNLDPGNYSVEETNPASHPIDVSDQDASNDGDTADTDTTVDNIIGVTLTAGEADTDNNFVDSNDGSISGSVTDDDTTAGIPGVTITLKDAGSIILATTTTDASGNYSFTNLDPDDYSVEETNPTSHPIDVSDLDSSPDGDAADADTTVDNIIGVTLAPGETDTGNDFVDNNDGSISGRVTDDDTGQGLVGVTITELYFNLTTTTDADGYYSFTDLEPSLTYLLVETNPASHPINISDHDESNDGDPGDSDTAVDDHIFVSLTPGEADTDNNFVDSNDGSITGRVTDADTGTGLVGILITLKDASGTDLATTVTDTNGDYGFADLEPGDYSVFETNPTTHPIDISDQDASDDGDPSDGDPTVDNTIGVRLAPGESDTDNNFVDRRGAGIFGSVTDEDTGAGLSGVTITLIGIPSGAVLDTTATDVAGNYSFTNLDPGDYSVEETNPVSHPTDISDRDESNDGDAADADTTVDNIIGVTLTAGEADTDNNFVDRASTSCTSQFVLVLDDQSTPGIDVIVTDDSPAGTPTPMGLTTHADLYAYEGLVFYSGPVGTFTTNRTSAMSDPIVGTAIEPEIRISSLNVGSSPGTIRVMATDTCFMLSQGIHQLMTPIGGIAGGTVELVETINLSNEPFSSTGPTNQLGPLGAGSFGQTVVSQFNVPSDTHASLSKTLTIVHDASNQLTSLAAGGMVSVASRELSAAGHAYPAGSKTRDAIFAHWADDPSAVAEAVEYRPAGLNREFMDQSPQDMVPIMERRISATQHGARQLEASGESVDPRAVDALLSTSEILLDWLHSFVPDG